MKRFSWLTTLVCLLSTSGVYAQQYRPVEPRYEGQSRNYQQESEGYGRPVRPVRYQDDLQLEEQRSGWPVNNYANRSADAADASRAVADQLRQQYQSGPNQPELQHAQGRGPTYYPAIPGNAPSRSGERPRSTVVEPARFSRPTSRGYDGPQSTDAAPGPVGGQTQMPPIPPQSMESHYHPTPQEHHHPQSGNMGHSGNMGQSYDPGYGPEQYGDAGCDDGYGYEHQGHGGRFRARRSMGMGAYAEGGYYGPEDCGDGSCGTGYDQGYYEDGYRNGRGPGSGGSRISRFFDKCGRDVYTVVGTRWLYMRRDGSDYRELSYENPMPTDRLLVSDADLGHQHGVEAFIVRQDDCGQGWEGRYWGLLSQTNTATLGNMPITQLTGLNLVNIGPWGTAAGLFNTADYHSVQRSSEFHSFEWNLLNHASVCANNNWLYRGIFGLRVLRFRDALQYSAHSATGFGLGFNSVNYSILTRNTFLGAQAGGSGEYCVTDKLRLGVGANAGIGTNFMEADQTIANSNGVVGIVPGFGNYSIMNEDNDLAVFGEFDARMYYHVSCNWRLSVGYRLLGLAGVALAQEQIPNTISDLSYVKRDGGLLLHGITLGAEFSY
ncbi:MAG: BBP7 family outer membrane beta-barrel protein [Planctomycetaceae bacterium]|nr:BBP7 family outer membrane beta-barrel protein [Planctomycetaceae bacterium]